MSERTPEGSQDHRYMVEDITVTPFFGRHRKHMAATIKLHAEIKEDEEYVILETKIAGYTEEDIEVSATPNTIDVSLVLGKKDAGDIKVHNSYFTPSPIDPAKLSVEHTDKVLRVKARKR